MRISYTGVQLACRASAPASASASTSIISRLLFTVSFKPPKHSYQPFESHSHHQLYRPFVPRRLYSSSSAPTTTPSKSKSKEVLIPMAGILVAALAVGAKIIYHNDNEDPKTPHTKIQKEYKPDNSHNNSNSMSNKLVPSNPEDVMVIRDLTPNVITLSVPFSRFGKLRVGGRATVVKLTSGNLAVFSPVALTPSVQKRISALGNGQISYIIASDIEHHIFVSDWAKAFPNAKIIGPEGLPEKRAKVADDPRIGKEAFAVVFTAANKSATSISPEFDADFEYEYMHSHPSKELVFFYKPDRVLIQADLMFNLPAKEQYSHVKDAGKEGVLSRIFSALGSTQGEAIKMKRFLWYVISKGDREGFNKSIKTIDAWDFDTIVPCHGETIVGDGKQVFRKVFDWHLQGKK